MHLSAWRRKDVHEVKNDPYCKIVNLEIEVFFFQHFGSDVVRSPSQQILIKSKNTFALFFLEQFWKVVAEAKIDDLDILHLLATFFKHNLHH